MISRPVYLDNHATTPVDPRVVESMLPFFSDVYGNASSSDHSHGMEAYKAVEKARAQVASLIRAKPKEIVFTSGATEANGLAIIGAAKALKSKGRHIVTSVIEHPSVLEACRHLEKSGWEVTYVPVKPDGLHEVSQFEAAIRDDTALVTIMAANNEIGVLQPIREIAQLANTAGALFHTDATQAVALTEVDVRTLGVDLLSFSAHKMYGPKGVGALFIRRSFPRVRLEKQSFGGGQEGGVRSGTLNVPAIVGFGRAAEIALSEKAREVERLRSLRSTLLDGLVSGIPRLEVNGDLEARLPNNLNIAITGLDARSILSIVNSELSVSLGSACATGSVVPSHVINALGLGNNRAHSSIRIGLGRFSSDSDIEFAVQTLVHASERVRAITRAK